MMTVGLQLTIISLCFNKTIILRLNNLVDKIEYIKTNAYTNDHSKFKKETQLFLL